MNIDNLERITVVGAGIMGHGIALVCALNRYLVCLVDVDEGKIRDAIDRIRFDLQTLLSLGMLNEKNMDEALTRISGKTRISDATEEADFVIEAVPEKMELKKQVFKELDKLCPEYTILASNTSTLRISEIAEATNRPDRVVGTHWMNPPYICPLVEVIRGDETSEDTLNAAISLLRKMGKEPIVCKDVPGFLVNRMQFAMTAEALNLLDQGAATIEDLDKVWTKHLGIRFCLMGPFEALDNLGLDTVLYCQSYLFEELKDPKFKPSEELKQKVKARELGLKSGRGFRNYEGTNTDDIIRERDKRLVWLLRKLKLI